MIPQQRKAILWALGILAAGCHLWHCRWRLLHSSQPFFAQSDLLAVSWESPASDSAQRLWPAYQAWLRYQSTIYHKQGSTRSVGLAPGLGRPTATDRKQLDAEADALFEKVTGKSRPQRTVDPAPVAREPWLIDLDRQEEQRQQNAAAAQAATASANAPTYDRLDALLDRRELDLCVQWVEAHAARHPATKAKIAELAKRLGVDPHTEDGLRVLIPDYARQCVDGPIVDLFESVAEPPLRPSYGAFGVYHVTDRDKALLGGALLPVALLGFLWWLRLGWRQRSTVPTD